MKLYIKQKVFSWRDDFTVKDESGADRYRVKGAVFSWGKKLEIADAAGNPLGYIQQKVFAIKPKYTIFYGEQELGEIVKKITFMKPKFTVSNYNWEVEGNFFTYTYKITAGGADIASMQRAYFTWGDSYEITINDPANEYLALAVVLAIDCVNASDSTSSKGVNIGGFKL